MALNNQVNIYFDFEFIDDGKSIIPISLGMCTHTPEDSPGPAGSTIPHELYLEYQFDPAQASDWVRDHVFPNLEQPVGFIGTGHKRHIVAQEVERWVASVCGESKPKFWGYYPSYDWVCLMQHWGTLMQKPKGWPSRPMCLKQYADTVLFDHSNFPAKPEDEHHALADAKWNRDLHMALLSNRIKGP